MYLLWTICDWTLRWVIGLVCHEYYESWMNRLLSDTAIVLWIPVLFSRCLQVSAGKYETFSYIKSTYLCLYDVCTVFSILLHRGLDSAWQLWLYLSKILLLHICWEYFEVFSRTISRFSRDNSFDKTLWNCHSKYFKIFNKYSVVQL